LRHLLAKPGDRYLLPLPGKFAPIALGAPATDVMTDLRRVSAVTIGPDASIDEANRTMIAHRVRALFVVDDVRRVSGIITSTDIVGEKPLQFMQERNVRHREIAVRDVMTPADRLEILELRDVALARVGDVVATLKVAGRQHALVVETIDEAMPVQRSVCGIFSLTQIARQLGIPPQQIHDIAHTFAEIQAAIAS
jgi:CBS domain-containing protein